MRVHTLIRFVILAAILTGGCSKRSEPNTDAQGLALGSLHSGTTIPQVIAEYGQPELAMTNNGVICMAMYQKLGLAFLASKGIVSSISVSPHCTLQTKEGVGIGSSRAAVIKAYGEPTSAKVNARGFEALTYQRLGLVCELKDNTVDSMTIIFDTAK
ncbi:MAG TPA: hypothetical protein VGI03_10540 [Verrucomicrobiae bacterium]|jgi:hypothetical protein